MLGWDAMMGVAWDRLFHAYGVATDTPEQLRNLASGDPDLQSEAVYHLNGAVLHQGTIYPVTPVVVRVVAGLLDDPSLRTPLPDDDDTMRAAVGKLFDQTSDATLVAVLEFLAEVGKSLAWAWPDLPDPLPQASQSDEDQFYTQLADEDDESAWDSPVPDVLMCQAVVELQTMADEVAAAIIPSIDDTDQKIRCLAAHATAQWCRSLDPHSPVASDASNVVAARLANAQGRPEQASLVLSAGQLGVDVSGFLHDPDEAVRCCAALFVHTEDATSMLIDALTYPDRVNQWFTMADRARYFSMNVRYRLLDEVINRGVTIDQMLPAAVALITSSGPYSADGEWGRLLKLAFPDARFYPDPGCEPGVRPPLPNRLTDAQRAVVQALVDNETLWDPTNGNANLARHKVGLPDDRAAVIDYLKQAST